MLMVALFPSIAMHTQPVAMTAAAFYHARCIAVLLLSLQPDSDMGTNACPLVAVPVNNAAFPRNPSPAYSGMACNQYLPSNTMDRFLWVINYFATNGFYVVSTALMQLHVLTLFKALNSRLPSPEKLRLLLAMLLGQYLL